MKQWKNQGGCPASGANKSWGRSPGERVIIDFGAGMFIDRQVQMRIL